ncbi:MAG: hypothetical protein JKY43_05870 [Phycisphaerales bacterium]|nr:hypothetical protein [Phycisphaerales bacterium]
MSFQAPSKYVKWLRYGFQLCMLSILGGLASPIIGIASGNTSMFLLLALALFVLASWCWPAGVWMITRSRKNIGQVAHDTTLDNTTLVLFIRMLSIAWPCWIMLIVFGLMSGTIGAPAGTGTRIALAYNILVATVGLIAWIGLIPACIYFAELAYWAADQWLANRLRSTAWVMTVFGTLMIVTKLLTMTSLPIAQPSKIVNLWTSIFCFLATVVLFYSMFKMSILLTWVLNHQNISADKHKRIAARIENQMAQGSKIPTATPCQECDYDLKGLPHKGNCPECGSAYGDPLLFPIRDPANDQPKHDGTALGIEESTHGKFTHSRPLGAPLEDIGQHEIEDGEAIPLADNPENKPENDPKNNPKNNPDDS